MYCYMLKHFDIKFVPLVSNFSYGYDDNKLIYCTGDYFKMFSYCGDI